MQIRHKYDVRLEQKIHAVPHIKTMSRIRYILQNSIAGPYLYILGMALFSIYLNIVVCSCTLFAAGCATYRCSSRILPYSSRTACRVELP
eukprot:5669358-Pleurochrysis_carterae.AAC.1